MTHTTTKHPIKGWVPFVLINKTGSCPEVLKWQQAFCRLAFFSQVCPEQGPTWAVCSSSGQFLFWRESSSDTWVCFDSIPFLCSLNSGDPWQALHTWKKTTRHMTYMASSRFVGCKRSNILTEISRHLMKSDSFNIYSTEVYTHKFCHTLWK